MSVNSEQSLATKKCPCNLALSSDLFTFAQDDIGVNGLELRCGSLTGHMGSGGSSSEQNCDANEAVCGLQVRGLGDQGGSDDVGVSELKFKCCNKGSNIILSIRIQGA